MVKLNRKFINKKSRKIAVFFLTVALVSGVVLAAYVNQAYKKGVASTTKVNTLFSSNYLQTWKEDSGVDKEKEYVILETTEDADTVQFIMQIRNYYSENNNKVCQKDIVYDLTVQLKGTPSGTMSNYSLTYEEDESHTPDPLQYADGQWSMDSHCVLTGRKASVNLFTFTMPKQDLGRVSFDILAKPVDTKITNGNCLAGIILPFEEGVLQAFSCEGTFADQNDSKMPYAYDAFNYEVSISTGVADVTLTWDASEVEIDPFFVKGLPAAEQTISTNGNLQSITYQMDASIQSARLIQFYRLSPPSDTDSWQRDWEAIKAVIQVTATQVTQ